MTNDLYFNISEIKLSITALLSVQIMSYLGASDIIYSDMIDRRSNLVPTHLVPTHFVPTPLV